MAKSTKALLTGRIQKCKTNPSIAHIGLATHGRSIHWVTSDPKPSRQRSLCPLRHPKRPSAMKMRSVARAIICSIRVSRRTAAKFASLFDEAGGVVRDMTEIDLTGEHA